MLTSIKFRMQDATPVGATNLCQSCVYGQVVRGQNLEERVFCNRNSFRALEMGFKVERCSAYYQRGLTSLDEMEKIAWIITTDTVGPIGFSQGAEGTLEVKIRKPEPAPVVVTPRTQ